MRAKHVYMRTLSLALVFAMMSAIAFASPALRLRKTVCQPDGSLLTIVKCGDEYRSIFATTDGYVAATAIAMCPLLM